MQSCGILCLLALGASHAAQVEVTPVQKVIQLMGGMLEKGKAARKEEQVEFSSKTQFCADTSKDKRAAIKEEKQVISNLKATIASQENRIEALTKKIATNQKDSDTWTGDIRAATKVRKIERSDYEITNKDYGESIDALGRAITTMKAKTADKGQASKKADFTFLQVSALKGLKLIPDSAKDTIDAFMQASDTDLESSDEAKAAKPGQANAYESSSGGIIDMLSKLEDKFTAERTTLQKQETETKNAHAMLLLNLNSQVKEADKDVADHKLDKSKTTQAKAGSESDKKEQEKLLASDTKYLKDLTASCAVDKAEFEAAQAMRLDELTAIEKAMSIISGGSVAGKATKHLGLLQESKTNAPSFGQLRTSVDTERQGRVAKILHAQAAKLNSRVLEAAAVKVGADPMKKVKNMIRDLIVKLMEESSAEADHKGFCDTAMATNLATRTEKTNDVDSLNNDINQLNSQISKLTQEIKKLNKQTEALAKAMTKATEIRKAEKAKNKSTIADAEEAQAAVAAAVTVLKEFQEKAADAATVTAAEAADAALLQTQAPYTGMASESGGIFGMLEVIESDFARLEAQTKASEDTNQREYDNFMTDSKTDHAGKTSATQHKDKKKTDTEAKLVIATNDLEGTQKELNAALKVFEKLKPSCVDQGVSYEERVEKRKEEIQSMKEALQVLEGEDQTN